MNAKTKKLFLVGGVVTAAAVPASLAVSLTSNTKKIEEIVNNEEKQEDSSETRQVARGANSPGLLTGDYTVGSSNTVTVKTKGNSGFSYNNEVSRGNPMKGIASPYGMLIPGWSDQGILTLVDPSTGKSTATINESLASNWLDGFYNSRYDRFVVLFYENTGSGGNLKVKLYDSTLTTKASYAWKCALADREHFIMTPNNSPGDSAIIQSRPALTGTGRRNYTYQINFTGSEITVYQKSNLNDNSGKYTIFSAFSDWVNNTQYIINLVQFENNSTYYLRVWSGNDYNDVALTSSYANATSHLESFPAHIPGVVEKLSHGTYFRMAVPLMYDNNNWWKVYLGDYNISTSNERKWDNSILILQDNGSSNANDVDINKMYVDAKQDIYIFSPYTWMDGKSYGKGILHYKFSDMGWGQYDDSAFRRVDNWIYNGDNKTSTFTKFYPVSTETDLFPMGDRGNIFVTKRDTQSDNAYIIDPTADGGNGGFAYSTTLASNIVVQNKEDVDAASLNTEKLRQHVSADALRRYTSGANKSSANYSVDYVTTPKEMYILGKVNATVTVSNVWWDGKKQSHTFTVVIEGFKKYTTKAISSIALTGALEGIEIDKVREEQILEFVRQQKEKIFIDLPTETLTNDITISDFNRDTANKQVTLNIKLAKYYQDGVLKTYNPSASPAVPQKSLPITITGFTKKTTDFVAKNEFDVNMPSVNPSNFIGDELQEYVYEHRSDFLTDLPNNFSKSDMSISKITPKDEAGTISLKIRVTNTHQGEPIEKVITLTGFKASTTKINIREFPYGDKDIHASDPSINIKLIKEIVVKNIHEIATGLPDPYDAETNTTISDLKRDALNGKVIFNLELKKVISNTGTTSGVIAISGYSTKGLTTVIDNNPKISGLNKLPSEVSIEELKQQIINNNWISGLPSSQELNSNNLEVQIVSYDDKTGELKASVQLMEGGWDNSKRQPIDFGEIVITGFKTESNIPWWMWLVLAGVIVLIIIIITAIIIARKKKKEKAEIVKLQAAKQHSKQLQYISTRSASLPPPSSKKHTTTTTTVTRRPTQSSSQKTTTKTVTKKPPTKK